MNDANQDEDREIEEPQEPVDPPQEKDPHKRKTAWVRESIQGVERYGALEEVHREKKRTRSCSSYVALLCDFIDKEPSNYEEAVERKEWKDCWVYVIFFPCVYGGEVCMSALQLDDPKGTFSYL